LKIRISIYSCPSGIDNEAHLNVYRTTSVPLRIGAIFEELPPRTSVKKQRYTIVYKSEAKEECLGFTGKTKDEIKD
jgi:hypothetical protein